MDPIRTVKASGPADLIALAPALVGFEPKRSLVAIPFSMGRASGAIRADLPGENADVDKIASTLTGIVCRVQGVDGVALIAFTDESETSARRILTASVERSVQCGLRIIDVLFVAAEGWGSLGGEPRPMSEIPTTDVPSPPAVSDLASLPDVSGERMVDVLTVLAEIDFADDADAYAHDWIGLAERVAVTEDPSSLSADDAAMLAYALRAPALRDTLIVTWLGGSEVGARALAAQIGWSEGHDYPEDIAKMMVGEAPRPLPSRLTNPLEAARHVAAIMPGEHRAGALATAAWLLWSLGRSSAAQAVVALAFEVDPEHGLAGIVYGMVSAGHLPSWAFSTTAYV